MFFSPMELPQRTQKGCIFNSLFDFKTTYIYALYLLIELFMLNNLHSITDLFITLIMLHNLRTVTEKKPIQTRSVRTPTDRESCPFIEGTAVYTARVLWSYFEPDAFFDDRYLCNAGNNKQENGSNSFFNVDSFIYSQIKQQLNDDAHIGKIERGETKMITVNDQQAISIYPNPASTFITIAYKNATDGYFKLFNTLGQVVMETELSAMNTKVQLLLTDIANGLYHYDISFLDGQQTQGKLLIQKK